MIDSQRNLRRLRRQPLSAEIPSTSSAPLQNQPVPAATLLCTPNIHDTPRKKKLRAVLSKQINLSDQRLKKLKNLQQKCRRMNRKISSLKNVIMELKSKSLINTESVEMLCDIGLENKDFLCRYIHKKKGHSVVREYSPELRKFAVTLNFLSPRAYTYVRQQFDSALPHPSTISKWYKVIDGTPGFTSESFETIKLKTVSGKKIYCALIIDGMAIRKLIEWDGVRYFGYVDIGNGLEGDNIPTAKEALVFMLTSLNENWKIPVGFFLIDGITGKQLSVLVKQCVSLLKECNIQLCFLTFDGLPSNLAMATDLGCSIQLDNLKTTFSCQESEIAIYPDPCHNIKLVRNTFAENQELIDESGEIISWQYVKDLSNLQVQEGFHAANKLRQQHITFEKQKMKVKLATQVLSASVADSLDMCREKQIQGFENSSSTSKFIRFFNHLFDIFNSRNMKAKGWKRPVADFNCKDIWSFFDNAEKYIKNLKFTNGELVVQSRRKTGFIGFIICMRSVRHIYNLHVSPKSDFKYLSTYKISQDHLELFFSAIRSKGGHNNNPSARQFISAYKRLLVHAQFKNDGKGNCIPLGEINILTSSSSNQYISDMNISTERYKMLENEMDEPLISDLDDHDYIFDPSRLTEFADSVIKHIAGFVIRKIKRKLVCSECVQSLEVTHDSENRLTSIKSKGGLLFASQDVIQVCTIAEKVLKKMIFLSGPLTVGLPQNLFRLVSQTFANCSHLFQVLLQHGIDQWNIDNHRNLLVKAVSEIYLKLRIHYITKQLVQPQERVRNYLNKTILFKGQ